MVTGDTYSVKSEHPLVGRTILTEHTSRSSLSEAITAKRVHAAGDIVLLARVGYTSAVTSR
jgi:hypothetical protein